MKRTLSVLLLLLFAAFANAQIKTPAPSPLQTIKQDFGLSSIEVSYSRPGVKGRKVFGDLVPFDKVWRTGANGATTLTFGDDVMIDNKKIPAGKYGLLTIPGQKMWTIIISKQTNVTSPAAYKPEEDVVSFQAKPTSIPFAIESFTIHIGDVKPESCQLYILWEKTAVSFTIKTEIESKIMSSIDASMKSDKPAYFQAAMYYLDNGKDVKQASEWLSKAVETNPDAFWIRYQQARAFAKAGKKTEAKQAALKSIELAKAAKNDDYVALNEKLLTSLK